MESVCLLREWGFVVVIFVQKKHKERKKGWHKINTLLVVDAAKVILLWNTPAILYIQTLLSCPLFFYSLFLLAFIRSSFLTRIPPTRRIVVRREEESWAKRRTPIDPCDERRGAVYQGTHVYTHIHKTIHGNRESVAAQSNKDSS